MAWSHCRQASAEVGGHRRRNPRVRLAEGDGEGASSVRTAGAGRGATVGPATSPRRVRASVAEAQSRGHTRPRRRPWAITARRRHSVLAQRVKKNWVAQRPACVFVRAPSSAWTITEEENVQEGERWLRKKYMGVRRRGSRTSAITPRLLSQGDADRGAETRRRDPSVKFPRPTAGTPAERILLPLCHSLP